MSTSRTDDHRTDTPRPLTVAERYARSVRASGDAWKNNGELAAPAPGVRHDATADHASDASDAPDTTDGVRLDVNNLPCIGALYSRHAARALSAWRNNGDGVVSR